MAPRAPKDLGPAGRRLYRQVLAEYDLTAADLYLLERACTTADRIARLQEMEIRSGLINVNPRGDIVTSAPTRELRQQDQLLGRQLAALRVIADSSDGDDETGRPQRRTGFRGAYGGLKAV